MIVTSASLGSAAFLRGFPARTQDIHALSSVLGNCLELQSEEDESPRRIPRGGAEPVLSYPDISGFSTLIGREVISCLQQRFV